jgi:peptide chain release factor 1
MDPRIARSLERIHVLEQELSQPEVVTDQKLYRKLTQEHAQLSELTLAYDLVEKLTRELGDTEILLKNETDAEFIQVLQEEIVKISEYLQNASGRLQLLLCPPGAYDHASTILEIRAGAGGDEAGLFVGDCVRMYMLFADSMAWKYESLSCTPSEKGGFKEYTMVLSGTNVYRFLQFEAGTHRVQRVPATEAQGRIHTSTVTVAVLLEPDDDDEIELNETELRIETTRSSGAGGQHVNKTDSAVRITHIPSGIVVFCQEERSQHKNKDKALRYLRAKIAEVERKKKKEAIDNTRAQQVGSGDRSEKIRTYNFPQNRITDHRINLTKYNLDRVLNGDLGEICTLLIRHFQQVAAA